MPRDGTSGHIRSHSHSNSHVEMGPVLVLARPNPAPYGHVVRSKNKRDNVTSAPENETHAAELHAILSATTGDDGIIDWSDRSLMTGLVWPSAVGVGRDRGDPLAEIHREHQLRRCHAGRSTAATRIVKWE